MVIGALMISYGSVYAEVVKFPTLTTDGLIDYQLDTFYPTNSTYIVQISLLYEVNRPIEIPEKFTWYELDGTAHFVYLQDDFKLAHFPADEEKELDFAGVITDEEIQKILDEKRQELAEKASSEFSKLRVCLEEFKAQSDETGDQRYYAWQRIANLQEFDIPDQWLNQDHYDREELKAQKKWVVCEALKKYPYIGAWEANKGLDEDDKVEIADYSDSPLTLDVTENMIEAEIVKAEAFKCSLQGKAQGLCSDYMSGDKYVPTFSRVPDWYNEYRELKAQPVELQLALDVAMLTQCDNYYQLYNQTDAIELPTWLEHCR